MAVLLDASATGPSPALDARILAAARDAAGQPSPWQSAPPTSVPAAAVDAQPRRHQRPRALRWARVGGMAASMVLVIGLGWRLALDGPLQREVAADQNAVSASEDSALLMQAPDAPPPPPPPPPEAVPPQVAEDAAATAANLPSSDAARPVVRRADPSAQKATASRPPAPDVRADVVPPASPPPAPAPAAPAPPPAAARAADSARPEQAATGNARALSPVAAPTAATGTAASAEGGALDRIEVSGTRIRVVDIDIGDDARLSIPAWLERIRLRRDEGDLDGARGSLARFRAQHPRIAIPDDLRALDVGPR